MAKVSSRAAKMTLNTTENILWSETTKCYEIFNINIPQYIFYIRLLVGMSDVEQELYTLLENLDSPPVVSEAHVARSLAFCVMFCRQLFVILAFFFWPLYCLPFLSFDLRLWLALWYLQTCLEAKTFIVSHDCRYGSIIFLSNTLSVATASVVQWSAYSPRVR